jgi:hypothetical protein
MFSVTVKQTHCVYRHVHFQRLQKRLYPGRREQWSGHRSIREIHTKIQDFECRMCLERITDGVPLFVAHPAKTKIQVNEAFVISKGSSDCKDFLVSDLVVAGKERSQALQTTISAEPISENDIVEVTKINFG